MESNGQLTIFPEKKSPVAIRREMVGNPAVMGALNPVERAVFLASTATTIGEYESSKLVSELKGALVWIAKDVGYRATDEADRQYIVIRTAELLKRYYSKLTLKDFRMAFEMSITGQLDDYLPRTREGKPDRGHYQQFNAEYVCKILDAYTARRGAVLKKAFESVEEPEPKQADGMKVEYRKAAIAELYGYFESFKVSGILNTSAMTDIVIYNILSEYGLAVPVEVSPDDQKRVWQKTINDYARRGYVGDVNRLKENGPDDPELEHGAFVLARHKAIKDVFKKIVEQGKTIQDYISL